MFKIIQDISRANKKRGSSLLFGIEVEMEFSRGVDSEYISVDHFENKNDGSLRRGVEFVSEKPTDYKKTLNYVNKLYEELSQHSPIISDRTSTHIHMDVRDFNRYQFAALLLLYHFYETSFLSMCEEKRRNSKYCIRGDVSFDSLKSKFDVLRDNTTSQLNAFRRGHDRRYCALNVVDPILRFGSVEFRMFEGNLDIEKFKLWLSIVNKIGLISKSCSTKRHIIYLYNWLLLHRERYFKKTFKELKYSSDCNEDALIQISDLIEEGFL